MTTAVMTLTLQLVVVPLQPVATVLLVAQVMVVGCI
jgi:hypothetical protein